MRFFVIRHLLSLRPEAGLRRVQLQPLITQITAVVVNVITVIFSHCDESQPKNCKAIKINKLSILLVWGVSVDSATGSCSEPIDPAPCLVCLPSQVFLHRSSSISFENTAKQYLSLFVNEPSMGMLRNGLESFTEHIPCVGAQARQRRQRKEIFVYKFQQCSECSINFPESRVLTIFKGYSNGNCRAKQHFELFTQPEVSIMSQ